MEHVREFFAAERAEDGKAVGTSLARSDGLGHVTGQHPVLRRPAVPRHAAPPHGAEPA